MMYEEALALIHGRKRLPSADSLQRISVLLDRIGHPERKTKFVHVTGTNGKGSFCRMLSEVLVAAGRKTGLFISPFIVDFRERIQINGEMISKEALTVLVERLLPKITEMEAAGQLISEFELDTVLAFCWFAEEKCDIAVLEVGVGGKLDATNCIPPPLLSVIMGIGIDHQITLGETVAEIAAQKAGIIKGNPVVSYPFQEAEALGEIYARCAETGSVVHQPSLGDLAVAEETWRGSVFSLGGESYSLSLVGRHQIYNAATVIEAARVLGVPGEAVKIGLQRASFPVRMEVMGTEPLVVLDGGHNLHGITALVDSVKRLSKKKPVVIIGMLRDKDFSDSVGKISEIAERVIAVKVDNPRSAKPEEIAGAVRGCLVTCCEDYAEALRLAQEIGDTLICGSLYLASDYRKLILVQKSEFRTSNPEVTSLPQHSQKAHKAAATSDRALP